MHGVLALTLQSMQHDMARLESISSNIANAVTPAYKREIAIESSFSDAVTKGLNGAVALPDAQSGAGLTVLADHRAGTLKTTGQSLDLALTGNGFFEISTKDGFSYTRQGNFQMDARGRLVTAQGLPVMGKSGEIYLTNRTPVIDAAGNIFDGKDATTSTAQIKLVQFEDLKSLQRSGDGLLTALPGASLVDAKDVQFHQGTLENSNVSSMEEMVHLMQTMRHFESMQKVAMGYDEMLGTAIRKLGDLS